MSVVLVQAYRFALDCTPAQERDLLAHAGAARVAFNWGLARVKAVMDQWAAERSYGVCADALTEAIGWSLPALRRAWNQPGRRTVRGFRQVILFTTLAAR